MSAWCCPQCNTWLAPWVESHRCVPQNAPRSKHDAPSVSREAMPPLTGPQSAVPAGAGYFGPPKDAPLLTDEEMAEIVRHVNEQAAAVESFDPNAEFRTDTFGS